MDKNEERMEKRGTGYILHLDMEDEKLKNLMEKGRKRREIERENEIKKK